MSPSGPGHLLSAPLLEREPELAAAAHAVDVLTGPDMTGARSRTGAGPASRTSLLVETGRHAAGRCTALSGEAVTSVPLHVLRRLRVPALLSLSEERLRGLYGDRFDITAPALGLAPPSVPLAEPQGVRDGLDRVVTRPTEQQREQPLAVLVDDAHRADAESLLWLAEFARRLPGLPLLLVLAHRADAPDEPTATLLRRVDERAGFTATLRALTVDGHHRPGPRGARRPHRRPVLPGTAGGHRRQPVRDGRAPRGRTGPGAGPVARSAGLLGASARGSGLVARLAALALTRAERSGTGTAVGEALHCAALFAAPGEAGALLARAVRHPEASPSAYEHALVRHDHALALGSRAELARAAALATACGADALAARAHQALSDLPAR